MMRTTVRTVSIRTSKYRSRAVCAAWCVVQRTRYTSHMYPTPQHTPQSTPTPHCPLTLCSRCMTSDMSITQHYSDASARTRLTSSQNPYERRTPVRDSARRSKRRCIRRYEQEHDARRAQWAVHSYFSGAGGRPYARAYTMSRPRGHQISWRSAASPASRHGVDGVEEPCPARCCRRTVDETPTRHHATRHGHSHSTWPLSIHTKHQPPPIQPPPRLCPRPA